MKISFNPQIKINTIKKYPTFCSQKLELKPLGQDIFISDAKKLQQAKNEEKYSALYDKVYDEVIEQNTDSYSEDIQKLKLNKPEFKIIDKENKKNSLATYLILNNSIELPRKVIDEDYFSYCIKADDGEIAYATNPFTSSTYDEDIIRYKEKYPDGKLIVFDDREKELYISGHLAHEIRHFLQKHLIASAKGTNKKAKKIWVKKSKKVITDLKKLEALRELKAKLEGKTYEKQKIEKPYFETYEPAELLDKDAKIRFSLLSGDNRYISAKEFFKSDEYTDKHKKKMEENGINYSYFANIGEIDAYNYGYEYLLFKAIEEEKKVRTDMLSTASYWQKEQSDLGLEYLQKKGYNPFVVEKK